MPRKSNAQVNIRSDYVRERVRQLAVETGKSATQVLEDAVRAYRPPPPFEEDLPPGLKRKGRLLVWDGGGVSEDEDSILRAIDEDRTRDPWADIED